MEFAERAHALAAIEGARNKRFASVELLVRPWDSQDAPRQDGYLDAGTNRNHPVPMKEPNTSLGVYIRLPREFPRETATLARLISVAMVEKFNSTPAIVACGIRDRQSDAYLEFQTKEEKESALHLNRIPMGRKFLTIYPFLDRCNVFSFRPDTVIEQQTNQPMDCVVERSGESPVNEIMDQPVEVPAKDVVMKQYVDDSRWEIPDKEYTVLISNLPDSITDRYHFQGIISDMIEETFKEIPEIVKIGIRKVSDEGFITFKNKDGAATAASLPDSQRDVGGTVFRILPWYHRFLHIAQLRRFLDSFDMDDMGDEKAKDRSLLTLSRELRIAKQERDDIRHRLRENEREREKDLNKANDECNNLRVKLDQALGELEAVGVLRQEVDSLRSENLRVKEDLGQKEKELQDTRREAMERDSVPSSGGQEIAKLKEELESWKQRYLQVSHSLALQTTSVLEDKRELRSRIAEEQAKRERVEGELMTLRNRPLKIKSDAN
jgi:hypothetical protein